MSAVRAFTRAGVVSDGGADQRIWRNGVAFGVRPRISLCVPFLGDDPRPLLAEIEVQTRHLEAAIDVLLLDDGTGDENLATGIQNFLSSLPFRATFIRLARNGGRAAARNILADHAEGDYLLFLDADTVPDAADFLRTYLTIAEERMPPVMIGGFSLRRAPKDPRFALHRYISARMDCLPAAVRNAAPAKYVYGSNILVRRDVMAACRFDPRYRGWGWEDQEWGIRVGRRWPVEHVDNNVSHCGLDDVDVLLRKYASSGENFRMILHDHPGIVREYPAYRAAVTLKRLPLLAYSKPVAEAVSRAGWLPMRMRLLAMRLYRSLHYLDA